MKKKEFEKFVHSVTDDLNLIVFPKIAAYLTAEPSRRKQLHPAFPFPKKVRVGLLPNHVAVEYVGPEDPLNEQFDVEGMWLSNGTVFDFLGIHLDHLDCQRIPFESNVENLQIFLGDAMNILGDYLYDVMVNPNDLMLNGIPDISVAKKSIFWSNVTFLWSDPGGAFRIRRIDFLELHPVEEDGWPYQTEESLDRFADFLADYEVPEYRPELHGILNDFIQLVADPHADEPKITAFLSDNAEILQLAFGVNDLNPQTKLLWQFPTTKPNLQPDFMPVRMDGYADIVEFKLPRVRSAPIVGSATRSHPSFEIDAALAQIDEYADWCAQEPNRRWLEQETGIKVHSPHTYLIVGHRDDFSAEDRQRLRGRRNATIFTYDEFIEMARMQLYRIR